MSVLNKVSRGVCLRRVMACFMVYCMLFNPSVLLADPSPGDDVLPTGILLGGTTPGVLLNYLPNTILDIASATGQTIITWDNFDIGANGTVNFLQNGGAVLNNVTGGPSGFAGATGIYGSLIAPDCSVFVVNDRGLVFGPQAYIQAVNFVGAAMRINRADFLAGADNYNFGLQGNRSNVIIRGRDGSSVIVDAEKFALIGRNIINKGVITLNPNGYVIMAAGDAVQLSLVEGNVFVEVTIPNVGGHGPSLHIIDNGVLNPGVSNSGIDAQGGKIILAAGDIFSTALEDIESLRAESYTDVYFSGDIGATGKVDIDAGSHGFSGNIEVQSIVAGGNIELSALDGDVTANDDLISESDIEIFSSDSTTYSTTYIGGDVLALGNVLLNNNTQFTGGNQTVEAFNGTLTANGQLYKPTWGDLLLYGGAAQGDAVDLNYSGPGFAAQTIGGNLWIIGKGDVQISGDVAAGVRCYDCSGDDDLGPRPFEPQYDDVQGGGVAIISEQGKIYTDGASANNDTLNISVYGSSNHRDQTGVYDIYQYGFAYNADRQGFIPRAAIAIHSNDDLILGDDAELRAFGMYFGRVNDRAGIGFLDTPGEIIGGFPRDEGDAFDLAIYLGSMTGDVHVGGEASILSFVSGPQIDDQIWPPSICIPRGAMVVDAYDSVTFGSNFLGSLENDVVGNRLEVSSRITEWLNDAVGRLPFPSDLILPPGYTYVMRGAGLENPAITDGRAWVLENIFIEPAPLDEQIQFPRVEGCPVEMQAVAAELGITVGTLQVAMGSALALNPNIQPCNACAKLINAAAILKDQNGTQVAALAQVVNEFASTPAPPSLAQMASIATSLASHTDDGTHYAAASQWVDALVEYVGVLNTEMGWSPEESTALAMNKYGATGDATLTEFVRMRLAALGG